MWSFASTSIGGTVGPKNNHVKLHPVGSDFSDDDGFSSTGREEGLECHICYESFNIVENIPYVLWCGHTLCKNCVLGLQLATVNLPSFPIQLPLFIACPWCNLLSFRLLYRGDLKFPRKNFFLLWMVESMNGDRVKLHSALRGEHRCIWSSNFDSNLDSQVNLSSPRRPPPYIQPEQPLDHNHISFVDDYWHLGRFHSSLRKSLAFFVDLTAKFPLLFMILLIVLYAIPTSVAILVLYIIVTLLFALPSFLIIYFALPCLDWLVREIMTWNAIRFISILWENVTQNHVELGVILFISILEMFQFDYFSILRMILDGLLCRESVKSGGLLWCGRGPGLLRLYLVAELGGCSGIVVGDEMLGCLTTFCEFMCLYDIWIYDGVNQPYEGDSSFFFF